jgi:hypothetical protein
MMGENGLNGLSPITPSEVMCRCSVAPHNRHSPKRISPVNPTKAPALEDASTI